MSLALSADTIAKLGQRDFKSKTPRESAIRKLLTARVKAYGGEVRAVSWLGRRSAPDVLCLFRPGSIYATLHNHLHCYVETKRPGKSASIAQAR